ncbi:MAG: hypothetical protein VX278_06760 [Myxococcota bacterium]|nr:hypothetical protein [Myxococcota bacterium]
MIQFWMMLLGGCSEKEQADTAQEDTSLPSDTADNSTEEDSSLGDSVSLSTGDAIALEQEILLEDVSQAWFNDGHLLAQTDDGLWLRDVSNGEWLSLDSNIQEEILAFGVGVNDELILSTDSAIWVLDNLRFRRSPLSDLFTEPVLNLMQDDTALWLQTDSALFQYKNGFLREVQFDGSSIQGAVATGTVSEGHPSIWIAGEEGAAELRIQGTNVATQAFFDYDGISHLIRSKGQTWMLDEEGSFFLFDTDWHPIDGFVEVIDWSAHPQAEPVWISNSNGVRLLSEGVFHETEQQGDILGTDSSGRLLLLDGGNLVRVADDRHIGIRNVPNLILSEGVMLYLDPMHRNDLTSLALKVDNQEVLLLDNAFELLPGHYDGGAHTLTATASYSDGSSFVTSKTFRIDGGDVLWESDISPLNVNYCLDCHAGGTNTELNTKQAWIDKIDRVLINVTDGTMPLSDEKLSLEEIALIEAWRDGGFQ